MRSRGPYDVIHTHLHHFNGFVLRCAAQAKIPVRVAHSHSDTSVGDAAATLLRRAYLHVNQAWIERYSTHGFAVSQAAAKVLFGQQWHSDARFSVLYCGIDLTAFEPGGSSREGLCRELNIDSDAMILGHIGRFTEAKNHRFLIEIFARIKQLEPRAVLILAGDGELRSDIEHRITQAGVQDSCRLIGVRNDIPRLFAGLDALLLPSRWEGLPLVLIESQAAGVPCVCSDAVTPEAVERSPLVTRLSVSQSAEEWARATIQAVCRRGLLAGRLQPLAGSRFDIQVGVRELERIYAGCAGEKVGV
jgi:glycosyltransferase involved in cell wall biosynthesis